MNTGKLERMVPWRVILEEPAVTNRDDFTVFLPFSA